MKKTATVLTPLACASAGCVPQYGSLRERAAAEGTCRDRPAQPFLGREATAELARQVVKVSGARTFEWIAPDMIVTLAFNPSRIRVTYDESMVVTEIRCGLRFPIPASLARARA